MKCMFKLVHIVNLLTTTYSTVAALYYPILDSLYLLQCTVILIDRVKCNRRVLYPVGYNPLLDQMKKIN